MKTKLRTSNKAKSKPAFAKPLFPCGDWISITLGIIMLSQTDGMGHYLGHIGIFLLMFTLIARPISFLWNKPLKYRRTLGILTFAAVVAHVICAYINVLDCNLAIILNMTAKQQWGVGAGIISLVALTPAAVTSFRFFQQKLGKKWRQIHLLTVPALVMASLHTVLTGPHYMAQFQMGILDYLRTYGIAIATLLVLLMRRRVFWSVLRLIKLIK